MTSSVFACSSNDEVILYNGQLILYISEIYKVNIIFADGYRMRVMINGSDGMASSAISHKSMATLMQYIS